MDIGFLGLGSMGSRMAQRLIDTEHDVAVYDPNGVAMAAAVASGATACGSPVEVANRAEIILCSLPIPAVVEEAFVGAQGLIHGSRCRIVIDLSTTGPIAAKRVSSKLAEAGKTYVDAPVSGGVAGAAAGTLAIMASGPEAAYGEALPFLKVLGGETVFNVGNEAGRGQAMKLANNMLAAATMIASFEALVFGVKAGLDPQTMLDIINVSSGVNHHTKNKIPNSVLNGSFPNNFATELMLKDVRLGVESAEQSGAPMWTINAVRDFLAFSVTQGDGPIDWANTIKHFERWAGVEVRSKKS